MKLLIVDDQNSVHMFFNKMLTDSSFGLTQVLHAYNGKEALDVLETDRPDIMMLDVKMPVMDGMETLHQIRERGFSVRTVILSAYNEFEYARQALQYDVKDYLLKPIDWQEVSALLTLLTENIRKDAVCQIRNVLEKCLKGQEAEPDAFVHPFERLSVNGYGFLAFRSEEGEWLDERIGENLLCSVSADNFILSLAVMDKSEEWEELKYIPVPGEMAFIGLSLFHENAMEAVDAMKQSVEALKQGFYDPGIHTYDEKFFPLTINSIEMNLAEQIRNAYAQGDVQEVKLLIERLFGIFKRNRIHPEYVQEFCYSFLLQLNKDFMTTFQQLKGSSFLSEFNCYDAVSLKNTVLRIMINMQCDFQPEEAGTDSDVVCRIKQYIDIHYDQDLSLDTMSKHFFIGKYQISRIFKKTYDINYSDYILKVRMENAAFLLHTTSCKLYEIAHRTGFEETSYFSNVFKKYYGITPNEYRKEK